MHGGQLSYQNIVIIPELDILIAAFAHQLYFFRLAGAGIVSKVSQHEHDIISIHYEPIGRLITSIDSAGHIFSAQIDAQGKFVATKKAKISSKQHITAAHISTNGSGETIIYAISSGHNLVRFVDGVTGLIRQNCQKLLYVSRELLIVRSQGRKLSVIDADSLRQRYQYVHPKSDVISVQIYNFSLIVGDDAGKITLLSSFLQTGQVHLKQRLQWHVHAVSALRVEQSYLYSGGEEGVVVLWHLRQNRRDFLPRVGAHIKSIKVVEAKVYCTLSDNSIKCIDLNNDKALQHYKTVIDPRGNLVKSSSSDRASSNLIRVTPMQDQIFMRSQPGRLQSIHLGNGVNTQYNVISRNATSRLDSGYPNPHQITDVAFSKDYSQFVAAIEGVNCRGLKFYFQDQGSFQLMSKVQNCHKGSQPIHLLTFGDKFVSFSSSDPAIKVWKRVTRRKQSILQVEDHYWACDYEVGYRNKLPSFVNISGDILTVVYQFEFVLFNTKGKKIEAVYSLENKQKTIIGVYQFDAKKKTFLVVYSLYMEKVELTQGKAQRLITLNQPITAFQACNITVNQKEQSIALLATFNNHQNVYIYKFNQAVQILEINTHNNRIITDLFWIGQRLLAFDSNLSFHDLTHSKQLIHLSQKYQIKPVVSQEMQSEQTEISDYDHLYSKYLERQFRKDRASIDKSSQLLQITPSITASFQLFTSQLFL